MTSFTSPASASVMAAWRTFAARRRSSSLPTAASGGMAATFGGDRPDDDLVGEGPGTNSPDHVVVGDG